MELVNLVKTQFHKIYALVESLRKCYLKKIQRELN